MMAGLWWSAVDVSHVTNSPQDVTAYGFKKMARISRGNVHVFQHPNFSIKSAHLKKDVKRKSEGASRSRTQRRKPLRKTKDQCQMGHQPSLSSSHLFPPAQRRNPRSLYQYINNEFTLPDSNHSEETPNTSSAETQSSSISTSDGEIWNSSP